MVNRAIAEFNISLPLFNQGKVRNIYEIDDAHLLIVTSDRISAFDVILPDPIPGKGVVLTVLSNFWFNMTQPIINNHLSDHLLTEVLADRAERDLLVDRAVVVKRSQPLPIEAVVRGYLAGSAWHDYQRSGTVCGISLPTGLQQAQPLPEVIFTPATKAAVGGHDENIDFDAVVALLGDERAQQVHDISIQLYKKAAVYALQRRIIIADTKFEFGISQDGELILIDEILTPDSSRFWATEQYQQGISPPSFDKQYVRDYLETLDWDKTAPGPHLPDDVIQQTRNKYFEAKQRLIKLKKS